MNKLFLYIVIGLVLVSGVFAVDKHDFVQLVENTPYCFDCHTIYKITKADDTSLAKLGVDFRDAKADLVFPEHELSVLRTESYTELVDLYEPRLETKSVMNNDTGQMEDVDYVTQVYAGTKEVQKSRTGYFSLSSFDALVDEFNSAKAGSEFYVKISGNLKPGEALDNVLTLNDFIYDEYAWWNNSCGKRLQFNKTGTANYNWTTTFFELNSTNMNWSAIYNESSLYVTNSSDVLVPFYVTEFNHSSDTGILWINASPYKNTTMTYYIYYNCTGMSDAQNPNATFLVFNDGRKNFSSLDTCKSFVNTSIARYGNSSIEVYHTYYCNMSLGGLTAGSFGRSPELIVEAWLYVGSGTLDFNGCYQSGTPYNVIVDNRITAGSNNIVYNETTPITVTPYTTATWRKTKQVINIGAVTSNASYYFDNMNTPNMSGLVRDDGNVTTCNHIISGGDSSNNWGLLDNVLAYPYYNWTAEVNSYGTEELFNNFSAANESYGREAIVAGIDASEIASSYVAYDDKQVYIRLTNGSQYKGTFDKLIVSGNNRWAFNYDQNSSSSFPAFFNITPMFYIWQRYNMSYDQIQLNVSDYINNTYS